MSIASLVLVALMTFVLLAPLAMVAVLVLGVPRHLARAATPEPAVEAPATRPAARTAAPTTRQPVAA